MATSSDRKTKEQLEEGTRPAVDTLRQIRYGALMDELSESIREVVAGVREAGKVGEITLKLKFRPASKGDTDVIQIQDTLTAKVPELDKGESLFFANNSNNLQRTDPRQGELEGIRSVDTSTGPVRSVAE